MLHHQLPDEGELTYLELLQEFLRPEAVVQVADALGQLRDRSVGPAFDLVLTRENISPKGQAYPQPIHVFLDSL